MYPDEDLGPRRPEGRWWRYMASFSGESLERYASMINQPRIGKVGVMLDLPDEEDGLEPTGYTNPI